MGPANPGGKDPARWDPRNAWRTRGRVGRLSDGTIHPGVPPCPGRTRSSMRDEQRRRARSTRRQLRRRGRPRRACRRARPTVASSAFAASIRMAGSSLVAACARRPAARRATSVGDDVGTVGSEALDSTRYTTRGTRAGADSPISLSVHDLHGPSACFTRTRSQVQVLLRPPPPAPGLSRGLESVTSARRACRLPDSAARAALVPCSLARRTRDRHPRPREVRRRHRARETTTNGKAWFDERRGRSRRR